MLDVSQRSVQLVVVTASVCDQILVYVQTDKLRQLAPLQWAQKKVVCILINIISNTISNGFLVGLKC